MAQAAADKTAQTYVLIDPAHTGGQDLVSNIQISDELLSRALVLSTDDRLFDEDGDFFDEEVLTEAEDEDLGSVLVWRHRRFDKG